MNSYINSYNTWRALHESMIDAESAVNKAKKHGLKLKSYSSNNPTPTKNLDKFPSGAPELVSAASTYGSASFESDLIDIVDIIQDETGIKLNITGGDDHFHRARSSRHTSGQAIDFVIDGTTSDDYQIKIENAVINIMKSGKYPHLGMINEYKNPSGHATGGHFHLSVGKSTEYSYFHFVKDKNGNRLTGKGQDFDNKLAELGAIVTNDKIYQGRELSPVEITGTSDLEIYTEPGIESNDNGIAQMKTF